MNLLTHSRYVRAIVWTTLVLGSLVARAVSAQPWSGILAPARAIDWSGKGVTGGIPTTWTQCGSTIGAGASVTTVNNAIAACGTNQYVKLGSGVFTFNSGIDISRNNVILRGSGADQTIINFTGDTSCLGASSAVCVRGDLSWYGPGPPARAATWTSGFAKGTTVVTLSNTTGLTAGMYLWLDQQDDAWPGGDSGGYLVCSTSNGCTDQGGTTNGRNGRGNRQAVKVVSCAPSCNNGGSTQVTITPGVYTPNVVSGKNPGAWWGNAGGWRGYVGIEDLSINAQNSGGNHAITLIFGGDLWIKGMRILFSPTPTTAINLYTVARVTVRDSYIYGTSTGTCQSQCYGFSAYGTSDLLVENNIVQLRAGPFVRNGDQGSVWAYNYAIDDCFGSSACNAGWFQAALYSHETGNAYILDEGNVVPGIKADIIHGPSNMWTYFRNVSFGWEPAPTSKTSETGAVKLYSHNRFHNIIGNLLGTSGYHTTYQSSSAVAIYSFGMAYNSGGGGAPSDNRVAESVMRWGNWDVVTSTNDSGTNDSTGTKWSIGEVPASDAHYPNAVPGSQTLPASFYLSARPDAWWATPWGTPPWPPIGPDVANGNITNKGGHAYKIPAQLCWENSPNDPVYPNPDTYNHRIKLFNASACYASAGGGSPPAAPSNFQVSP